MSDTLDEDLAAMYLTDKKENKPRELTDHEELEVLLESFSKQVEEIVNESETIAVLFFYELIIYISTDACSSCLDQRFFDTGNC